MKFSRLLTVFAVAAASVPQIANAAEPVIVSEPVRIVVQFDGAVVSTSTLDAAVGSANVDAVGAVSAKTRVYEIDGVQGAAETAEAMADIESLPGVREVFVDTKVYPAVSDTYYANQWYLSEPQGINAPAAWQYATGEGVRVAVVDTGHTTHPDLDANIINGYDFISDVDISADGDARDADASDPGDYTNINNCDVTGSSSWHGTHVSGTIAAVSNSIGVAGVAYNSKVLSIRALGTCGGLMSDIIAGVRWAAGLSVPGVPTNQNPVRIINLSLGSTGTCQTWVQTALNEVAAAGALVVVAAGNSNTDASNATPASCANVVTVAATNSIGNKSSFSNYGAVVDIAAPGSNIVSTWNNGDTGPSTPTYEYLSGTSMAAPQVSAVAALVLSLQPTLSLADVRSRLLTTARAFSAGSTCTTSICGTGIVDANAAVAMSAAVVPSAPRNVTAVQVGPIVRVSWEVPTSSGTSTVTGYTVTGSNGCSTILLTCDFTGFTAGSQTKFSVRALNTSGRGVTGSSQVLTYVGVPPSAPNHPVVTIDGLSANVSWQAPATNGGLPITSYTVTSSPNGSCTTTGTTCTINDLQPETTYSFSIVASNSSGSGTAATSGGHTTAASPAAPTATAVSFGETSAMVSWENGTGGLSVSKYIATAVPGGSTCETTGTRCSISGLSPGTSYSVTLVAVGPAGTHTTTSAMSGTTTNTVSTTPPVTVPVSTVPVTTPVVTVPVTTTPSKPVVTRVKRGSRTSLTKLLKLGTVKPTWRVTGTCKVSKSVLIAPKKKTTCKVTGKYKVRGRTKTVTRTISVV